MTDEGIRALRSRYETRFYPACRDVVTLADEALRRGKQLHAMILATRRAELDQAHERIARLEAALRDIDSETVCKDIQSLLREALRRISDKARAALEEKP